MTILYGYVDLIIQWLLKFYEMFHTTILVMLQLSYYYLSSRTYSIFTVVIQLSYFVFTQETIIGLIRYLQGIGEQEIDTVTINELKVV